MKTLLRSLVLLLLLLLPAAVRAQSTVTGTIVSGGITREYRLYVPAAYSPGKAVPLLFNLHGYGSNNLEQEAYGDFRPIADTANFLIVHPNGTVDAAGNRNWNTFTAPTAGGVDDVAFLSDLLTSLQARYSIDADRVYSTGMSNGGFMSYELACKLSNRVAAIGSVTGSMVQSRLNACTPQHPVPVMEIHGTADNTVPYNGNILFVPIPSVLDYWVRFNGCSPTPVVTAVPNTNTTDGSTAERYVYSGGRNGSVVEHYKILDGGHTWPGAPVSIGVTNRDINASREVWRFLRRYRLSQLSVALSTRPGTGVQSQVNIYPNPAQNIVAVCSAELLSSSQVAATDLLGRSQALTARLIEPGVVEVRIDSWPAGVYQLRVVHKYGVSYHRLTKQ
ncbi:extracellular catalytic domain type 1 short-chain-length polyhydroxyalkanoate depolymerase [Hymenobacter cellulosivorans]|uniref:T9SS type A sorting domain-containing protein n=1 Tax=Hymenobacter cellulosivorans TaxID=2932249 RepID=A0ABY4FDM8_9BACT|nr:PHB depolymerase family esterase [Hymenobacter cellulosivorans]UOQ54789.1 T9SS type A sorting domain-containing protein [Hymenobacter cellulosivorans]